MFSFSDIYVFYIYCEAMEQPESGAQFWRKAAVLNIHPREASAFPETISSRPNGREGNWGEDKRYFSVMVGGIDKEHFLSWMIVESSVDFHVNSSYFQSLSHCLELSGWKFIEHIACLLSLKLLCLLLMMYIPSWWFDDDKFEYCFQ